MRNFVFLIMLAVPLLGTEYAVMIDAGSAGSRVFVYQYESLQVKLLGHLKVEPGISSFKNHPEDIKEYFVPLIDFVKKQLQGKSPLKQISLRLEATGGVRALPKAQQRWVIRATSQALSTFGFKEAKAEVISGVTEGIYQWIAINYLQGTLEKMSSNVLAGLIELGGASMQVTFMPSKNKKLYSKTYDGLGENTAWKTYGAKYCKNTPLDFKTCRDELNARLANLKPLNLLGQFYLIDHFYRLAKVIQLSAISSEALDALGPQTCGLSLKELKKRYPEEPESYLQKVCFNLTYMSVVLERLGFPRNRELKPVQEVNGTALSWTLGSLLYRLPAFPKNVIHAIKG